jgi:hypothetical protein
MMTQAAWLLWARRLAFADTHNLVFSQTSNDENG